MRFLQKKRRKMKKSLKKLDTMTYFLLYLKEMANFCANKHQEFELALAGAEMVFAGNGEKAASRVRMRAGGFTPPPPV
jgi:hypothetical protein